MINIFELKEMLKGLMRLSSLHFLDKCKLIENQQKYILKVFALHIYTYGL